MPKLQKQLELDSQNNIERMGLLTDLSVPIYMLKTKLIFFTKSCLKSAVQHICDALYITVL